MDIVEYAANKSVGQPYYIRTGGGKAAGRDGDGGSGGERECVHVLREVGRCSVG